MTDPDENLSAIDAAIEGWNGYDDTVSDDAMRWAPEQPEREWRGAEPTLTIRDEVHLISAGPVYIAPVGTPPGLNSGEWRQIGWATDAGLGIDALGIDEPENEPLTWPTGPVSHTMTLTADQVQVFRDFAEHLKRQHAAMVRACQGFGRSLLKTVARAHVMTAPATYGDAYGKHRHRCRSCNPAGNPKPLKVNGADYARRRKNRSRRG
jgi:hypothetical protein